MIRKPLTPVVHARDCQVCVVLQKLLCPDTSRCSGGGSSGVATDADQQPDTYQLSEDRRAAVGQER
jgi:hypothetical protein